MRSRRPKDYEALGSPRLLESDIQKAVVEYLHLIAPWDSPSAPFMWHSIPNESKRHPKQATTLKKMGLRPGAPDLIIVTDSGVLYIELKTPKGKMRESQMRFQLDCIEHGVPYVVCRSLDDVQKELKNWGFYG